MLRQVVLVINDNVEDRVYNVGKYENIYIKIYIYNTLHIYPDDKFINSLEGSSIIDIKMIE